MNPRRLTSWELLYPSHLALRIPVGVAKEGTGSTPAPRLRGLHPSLANIGLEHCSFPWPFRPGGNVSLMFPFSGASPSLVGSLNPTHTSVNVPSLNSLWPHPLSSLSVSCQDPTDTLNIQSKAGHHSWERSQWQEAWDHGGWRTGPPWLIVHAVVPLIH